MFSKKILQNKDTSIQLIQLIINTFCVIFVIIHFVIVSGACEHNNDYYDWNVRTRVFILCC